MYPYSNRSMRDMTEPATAAFEFWVSFWPIAPVFGVEWRFAPLAEAMTGNVGFGAGLVRAGARAQAMATGEVAEAQARAAGELADAPAIAAPVSDEALEGTVKRAERAIEQALEPAEAVTAAAAEAAGTASRDTAGTAEAVTGAATEKAEAVRDTTRAAAREAVRETTAQQSLDIGPADEARPARPASLLDKAPASADDLKLIKGIGPGLEKQLHGLGVYTFRQIAGFSEQDLAWVDDNLTAFKGRCFRDDWIGQARARLH